MAPPFAFFFLILFTFENQPTKQSKLYTGDFPRGAGLMYLFSGICPAGFWAQRGLGAMPLPSKSQVVQPKNSAQVHSQPAFPSG